MLVTAAFSDVIVGVHVLAAIIGFGIVFAYPVMLAAAARTDPGITPWLLRTRQRIGRYIVNPGLLVLVLAGIYLASDEHQWSAFYVGWGIVAVLVIGAIEGAIMIPRSGRLAAVAERDLAASAVPSGGQRVSADWSDDYLSGYRLLTRAGWAIQAIVVVTTILMTTHAGGS